MNIPAKTDIQTASDHDQRAQAWWATSQTSILILIILYLVGILGVALPLHPDFLMLTPFNLLVSLGLLLRHHPSPDRKLLFFLLLCYGIGFGAELFGVQTGLLFGEYSYGAVLGPKIWGTPLMIGVNWMLLTYAAGVLAYSLAPQLFWLPRAGLAALLMVGLDIVIEPVAMTHDFWSWAGNTVPFRNYAGWFAVAFPLQCYFARYLGTVRNKVAVALFILQLVFFFALNWL